MFMQLAIILVLYFCGNGVLMLLCFIAGLQVAWLMVWHFMAHREIKLRFMETLLDISPFAVSAAVSMAAAWGAAMLVDCMAAKLAVKFLIAAVSYCAIMHFAHAEIFRESVEFVFSKLRKH